MSRPCRRSAGRSRARASCRRAASAPRTRRLPGAAVGGGRRRELDGGSRTDRGGRLRRGPAPDGRSGRARDRGGAGVSGLTLRPASECRYDLVALGEIMLRLDPGEGRIRDEPPVHGLGGRRRVQRRPRAAPLLRPPHGGRDRLGGQRRRPPARGSRAPGRSRHVARALGSLRRRRPHGSQRAQLHRARIRRARSAWASRTAATRPPRSSGRERSTGSTCSARWGCAGSTRAASSPRLSETTPEVVEEAVAAAARHGTVVSYDLNYRPSLWKGIGGVERAREVNRRLATNVDVMIGNEEDFTACLGLEVEGDGRQPERARHRLVPRR